MPKARVVAGDGLVAPTCRWSSTTSSSEATSKSDATSVVAASVLFGLEEEFCVLQVERVDVGLPLRSADPQLDNSPRPSRLTRCFLQMGDPTLADLLSSLISLFSHVCFSCSKRPNSALAKVAKAPSALLNAFLSRRWYALSMSSSQWRHSGPS
jgi:hypothetical protein